MEEPARKVEPQQRLLDWRSGGWVLALMALLLALVVLRFIWPGLSREAPPAATADPDAADNGFDLSGSLVPRELIVVGAERGTIRALTDPNTIAGAEVVEYNAERRGKFLVSGDRVIGVTIGAESRAYPLRILNWHEIANDTLGGTEIAVTYCPLSDSAAVFRRDVTGDVPAFEVSGLLLNSNLLMYDVRDGGGESLWSQLQLRAVAGAAAGTELQLVAAELSHWGDWLARHPETTVITGRDEYKSRYKRNPYGHYFETGRPRFPVSPAVPADGLPAMARVLAVQDGEGWHVLAYHDPLVDAGDQPRRWQDDALGLGLSWQPHAAGMEPPTLRAMHGIEPVGAVYAFWFAWSAMHPDAPPPQQVPQPTP